MYGQGEIDSVSVRTYPRTSPHESEENVIEKVKVRFSLTADYITFFWQPSVPDDNVLATTYGIAEIVEWKFIGKRGARLP